MQLLRFMNTSCMCADHTWPFLRRCWCWCLSFPSVSNSIWQCTHQFSLKNLTYPSMHYCLFSFMLSDPRKHTSRQPLFKKDFSNHQLLQNRFFALYFSLASEQVFRSIVFLFGLSLILRHVSDCPEKNWPLWHCLMRQGACRATS